MLTTMHKQPHHGMMMGPMKGHLAPNSSPFKPTINKLSSQYLIQDHMSNHYMKLGTAKPAIDNKPPKSMANSVKKRDQMRREAMAKQMKLFDLEKEMKNSGASSHRQQTPDSSLYGSQRYLSVTVTKNGYDEPRPQSVSSYRSGKLSPRPRSLSSSRSLGGFNPNSPRDRTRKPDALTETYSGDYLDKHENRFKNVNAPFTPRLKKRSGKSFLSQSKHYAAPMVTHKETKRKTASRSSRKGDDISPVSSMSDIHRQERSTSRGEVKDSKPPDDILDSMSRLSLDDSRRTYDNIYPERSSYDAYGFRRSTNDNFFGTSSLGRTFSRNDAYSHDKKNRIEAEEEEMKYLEFINTVTNDILTRGIYSDRVLTQVMQRHLDQNRGRLNEGRMRHMLMKLQEDLGVSSGFTMRGFDTAKYTGSYDESFTSGYTKHRDLDRDSIRSSSSATKKRSKENLAVTKKPVDGATSDGSGGSRRGILRVPGTSSGSDLDAKSTLLSSGDEREETRPKKVTIENGVHENSIDVVEEIKSHLTTTEKLDGDEKHTKEAKKSGSISTPPTPKKRTHVSGVNPKTYDDDKFGDALHNEDVVSLNVESANSDLDDF